jgi:hypothetical protein
MKDRNKLMAERNGMHQWRGTPNNGALTIDLLLKKRHSTAPPDESR